MTSAVMQQALLMVQSVRFPTIATTNQSATGSSNSYNASLPSGLTSGDLILLFVSGSDNGATTINQPTDWNTLYNDVGPGDQRRAICYYKTSNGSEGATVNITANRTIAWATTSYRISTGTWQGTPEAGTAATGTSANPDPPSLSPSWGAASGTLWIAAEHDACTSATVPTPPTNYTDQLRDRATDGTNGAAQCATARRFIAAASQDPNTFTIGISGAWTANTVAVRGL